MGKLQKTSSEKQISVFDAILNSHVPLNQRQPEMKQPKQDQPKDRSWAAISTAQKLAHSTPDEVDLVRSGRSIRSARCSTEGITNIGGSGNQVGSSRNSVANKDLLDKIAALSSSSERTKEERKASKNMREMKQQEFRSANSPKIGEDEAAQLSRKSASLNSSSGQMSSRYMPPTGKISIFDNSDFERLEATAGEKMAKREAKKDDSWQKVSKAHTSRDVANKVFDNLAEQPAKNNYKSIQNESSDRLFNAIMNSKKK